MVVSKRQFNHLTEMGIQLWQRKSIDCVTTDVHSSDNATQPLLTFNYPQLIESQIFRDVLLCLNISSSDVIHYNNQLKLGTIFWQFSSEKSFTVSNNTLTTPEFAVINESNSLKAQLWQTIQQNNLL